MRCIYALLLLMIVFKTYGQNALNFDGIDDYVETTMAGPQGTSPRTVEAWIKTNFVGNQKVLCDWGDMALGHRFTFNLINGKMRIEVGGSGMNGATIVSDGNWHHVAAVYNPSSALPYFLYVDGILDANGTLSQSMNTSNLNPVIIGRRNDGVNYWEGEIDELRIWSVAKTVSEINAGMNQSICNLNSDLVYYYTFDQGVPGGTNTGLTTLNDQTSNSNDGTLFNFALTGNSSNWLTGASVNVGTSFDTLIVTSCGPYTSPSGNNVWTVSGTYTDSLVSGTGCDSILSINLNIVSSSTSNIVESVCEEYTSPSGNYVWMSSGIYTDTISNSVGCDSIITIDLTVISIDTSISFSNNVISSNEPNGQYQWYRCQSGNFTSINGATSQNFTISQSGFYAVIIDNQGCIDTSACNLHTYLPLGMISNAKSDVKIYPNPAKDSFKIHVEGGEVSIKDIGIYDSNGMEIMKRQSKSGIVDLKGIKPGLYIVKIETEYTIYHTKLRIE